MVGTRDCVFPSNTHHFLCWKRRTHPRPKTLCSCIQNAQMVFISQTSPCCVGQRCVRHSMAAVHAPYQPFELMRLVGNKGSVAPCTARVLWIPLRHFPDPSSHLDVVADLAVDHLAVHFRRLAKSDPRRPPPNTSSPEPAAPAAECPVPADVPNSPGFPAFFCSVGFRWRSASKGPERFTSVRTRTESNG